MKWLIAVLAAIAAAGIGAFLWRKNAKDVWTQATDATSSFGKTASDKVGDAASTAGDEIKDAVAQ